MSFRRAACAAALFLITVPLAAASLQERMQEVERIRGLSFTRDVATVAIDRDELPARLREQIDKSLPYTLDDYDLILRALHLIGPETKDDAATVMLRLMQAQVLAFYDPLTHTYYSIRQMPAASKELGDMSAMLEDAVVVHELTHALQDQRFRIGERDLELRKDADASLAYHAVMEGEAMLVMMAWMLGKAGVSIDTVLGNESAMNLMGGAAASERFAETGAPPYFVESLKFPYLEGFKLVAQAYRNGGWKELDRVHANPPWSTREVLHPEEYFERLRVTGGGFRAFATRPALDVPGVLTVEHLGEFHWGFLVGAENARGWVNDRVTVVQDATCAPTVLVETKWESAEQARTFRDAYVGRLMKQGTAPNVVWEGSEVKVGYGADAALIGRFAP